MSLAARDPMRGWVDSFPEMLEEAWGTDPPDGFSTSPSRITLIGGMGGSGMAGALIAPWLARMGRLVVPWGNPAIPGWVTDRDSIVIASYSGETWEAIALLEEGAARGLPLRAIASGGRLAGRCEDLGIPLFSLPVGMAPRASLPWLLAAVLRATGGMDDEGIRDAAAALRADRDLPPPGRDAAGIAGKIERRIPILIPAGSEMEPVAVRWRNQILENAKQAAFVSPLPEMAHNEIMGWAHLRVAEVPIIFVALDSREAPAPLHGILADLEDEARAHGHSFIAVPAPDAEGFAGHLAQAQLGDRVSVALADRLGVPATPVDAIRRLRDRMGKEGI